MGFGSHCSCLSKYAVDRRLRTCSIEGNQWVDTYAACACGAKCQSAAGQQSTEAMDCTRSKSLDYRPSAVATEDPPNRLRRQLEQAGANHIADRPNPCNRDWSMPFLPLTHERPRAFDAGATAPGERSCFRCDTSTCDAAGLISYKKQDKRVLRLDVSRKIDVGRRALGWYQ